MTGRTPLDEDVEGVSRLLSSRSVVVVGASDRSRWTSALVANLTGHGFDGPLHLVNPRGSIVGGRPTAPSCEALGEQVDLGVVVVPSHAAVEAVAGLAGAGVRSAVVLTSGFAEVGPEGERLQREMCAAAAQAGIRMLGPNSLGFLSFAGRLLAWSTPIKVPSRTDGVALVSQSGATALFLAGMAYQQDVALSHVIATGNEADLDGSAVVRYLADDPHTRAIAVFVESIRNPERFVAAAEAARAAGKPLVVLKVGASEVAARAALAHTGALVGDDRVFDGVCARHDILRVHSLEDLLTTADVLARTGPLSSGGLCVVSNSGGICEIAADTAQRLDIELPVVSATAEADLRKAIPDYATPHNPLDLTGGVLPENCEDIVAALAGSTDCAAVVVVFYPVPASAEDIDERLSAMYQHLAAGLRDAPVPGFLVSYTGGAITQDGRKIISDLGMPYLACGLDGVLKAFAGAFRWSRRQAQLHGTPRPAAAISEPISEPCAEPIAERPGSAHETLTLLRAHGVPVVAESLATDEAEAQAAARAAGGPVALKIASADIGHKTEIGGVELAVAGDDEVVAAFRRVLAAGRAVPGAAIDGVLVAPMRTGGVELFVGCSTDPVWGPVLAVGLGGIWVEVFSDVAVRPLPVSATEVVDMLRGLRGARLLAGERGTPAADLEAVGEAVAAIGALALRVGPELAALDINPLWVCGDQVEALDALAVWTT